MSVSDSHGTGVQVVPGSFCGGGAGAVVVLVLLVLLVLLLLLVVVVAAAAVAAVVVLVLACWCWGCCWLCTVGYRGKGINEEAGSEGSAGVTCAFPSA